MQRSVNVVLSVIPPSLGLLLVGSFESWCHPEARVGHTPSWWDWGKHTLSTGDIFSIHLHWLRQTPLGAFFCKHECIKSSLHIGLLVAFNRFDSELRVIGKNIMTGPGRQRVWLVGVSYLHIKWSEKRDVKVFNDYLQRRGQCRLITLCVPATEGVTTWHSFAYCGKLDKLKLRNLKLQHWWKKSKLFLIQFYFQ